MESLVNIKAIFLGKKTATPGARFFTKEKSFCGTSL
jgi:hypothetical protein